MSAGSWSRLATGSHVWSLLWYNTCRMLPRIVGLCLLPFLYSEKALVLVDSVSVGPAGSWLVLNVTDPLSSWVAFPDLNLGLYLSVHLPNKPGKWKQPTLPNRTVPKATHSWSKSKQLRCKDSCHVTGTNSLEATSYALSSVVWI